MEFSKTITPEHSVRITGTIVSNLWQASATGEPCDNVDKNLNLQYGSLAKELRQMGFGVFESKMIMSEHLDMALSFINDLAQKQGQL